MKICKLFIFLISILNICHFFSVTFKKQSMPSMAMSTIYYIENPKTIDTICGVRDFSRNKLKDTPTGRHISSGRCKNERNNLIELVIIEVSIKLFSVGIICLVMIDSCHVTQAAAALSNKTVIIVK